MKYVVSAVVVALVGAAASGVTASRAPAPGEPARAIGPRRSGPAAPGAVDDFGGDVGLVARREVRERVKGRTFRVGTLIILLAVAAAVTIPVLRKSSKPISRSVSSAPCRRRCAPP